jgi:hypothetical protein
VERLVQLALVQVDQVVQPEIVLAVLADNAQVDQVVQPEIVPAVLADLVQPEIVPAVLADLVQPEIVPAVLQARVHQAVHQVADQVADQIQLVVAATLLAHSANQVAGLQRVVSQSGQSVKSSTTWWLRSQVDHLWQWGVVMQFV